MTNKAQIKQRDATSALQIRDNGGRRSGIDRRQFSYDGHIPERRLRSGRRIIIDRRIGLDRRSGIDRRSGSDRRKSKLRGRDRRGRNLLNAHRSMH